MGGEMGGGGGGGDVRKAPVPAKKRQFLGLDQPGQHVKVGLIGYPNAGKSMLWNALVNPEKVRAEVEDFLFSTLDVMIGVLTYPDPRLEWLVGIYRAERGISTKVSVIDGPAIVPGSSQGAGEGMAWLSSFRDVGVLVHVLRGFEDLDVTHYQETVDPVRDLVCCTNELMRFDLLVVETKLLELEAQIESLKYESKAVGLYIKYELKTFLKAWSVLVGRDRPIYEKNPPGHKKGAPPPPREPLPDICDGVCLRFGSWNADEIELLCRFDFMTSKETVYVLNVSSRDFVRKYDKWEVPVRAAIERQGGGSLVCLSTAFEQRWLEIIANGEMTTYRAANPSHETSIPSLLYDCQRALDLISFYTTFPPESLGMTKQRREAKGGGDAGGEEEDVIEEEDDKGPEYIKAWSCRQGKSVLEASALTDVNLSRTFNKALVYTFDDLTEYNGDFGALKENGKHRLQIKRYEVNDGDVISFLALEKSPSSPGK